MLNKKFKKRLFVLFLLGFFVLSEPAHAANPLTDASSSIFNFYQNHIINPLSQIWIGIFVSSPDVTTPVTVPKNTTVTSNPKTTTAPSPVIFRNSIQNSTSNLDKPIQNTYVTNNYYPTTTIRDTISGGNNIVDTSQFVPRSLFDGQVNATYNSVSNNFITFAQGLAKIFNTATLNVSGDASIGGVLGIGTTSIDPSALLQLDSTGKGLLLPRLTSMQKNAIGTPASGLVIYDTDLNKLNVFNGITWKNVGSAEIGGEVTNATAGSILFINPANTLAQDNAKFFWDSTNHRLGIGTATPSQNLDVAGNFNLNTNGTPALFSTFMPTSTDGANIFIGGGGQSSIYDGSHSYTGSSNTALGIDTLHYNTTGYENTTIGKDSLKWNTTGYQNTASGMNALLFNSTGYGNTANGFNTLSVNSTGHENTASGVNTLTMNSDGYYNTASGAYALQNNTTGYQNTANGANALAVNSTGYQNTAVGVNAFFFSSTGYLNTGIGFQAGYNGSNPFQTLTNSTFLGANANASVSGIDNSTAIGSGAQVTQSNQIVLGNTSVTQTLLNGNVGIGTSITSAALLTVNGTFKLKNTLIQEIGTRSISIGAGTPSVTDSFFFGDSAGAGATSASDSNFLGPNAGQNATNAYYSNFFGVTAGYGATNANESNFFGLNSGYGATDASYSNFLGSFAGQNATNANQSNFFGEGAGNGATWASSSNFLGYNAGYNATYADHSNFFGEGAGNGATWAGSSNFLGFNAGNGATDADHSILIGYQVGQSFTSNNISSNNIIIGTNISLPDAATNSINIGGILFGTGTYGNTSGNPSITSVSGGRIGIGTVSPSTIFEIGSSDLGNGVAGPVITLGRNSNAINTGAGSINFMKKSGTAGYVWQDNAGNMRINTSAPSNANDTTGTVIGAQTSTRDTKQDIADYTDYNSALSMVLNAPLHTFRYIKDVQGYGDTSPLAKTRIGYIADEVPAQFMWGNSIDQVSVNGIILASIKQLNLKINDINNIDKPNDWRDSLVAWFGNTANGINDMFAGTLHAKDKLCIGDTCVTENQLKLLLQNQNNLSGVSTPPTTPAPDSTPIPAPENIPPPTPTPDPSVPPPTPDTIPPVAT